MPELREVYASYLLVKTFFQKHIHASWKVEGIWADGTDKEANNAPGSSRVAQGHVYELEPTHKVKRGCRKSQNSVWPPKFGSKPGTPADLSVVTALRLESVHTTARALVLNFGAMFLSLQYLTHTAPQFYTKDVWTDSICNVTKTVRGFRVAVAFAFKDYVLSFNSIDLVFHPTWALKREDLPHQHIDVVDNYMMFLLGVAYWVIENMAKSRKRLAVLAIRQANLVWPGVGSYTISEIFFLAGLSTSLTEKELVDSPSRLARLCEALYEYAVLSRENIWEFIRPAIRGGMLAPTQAQRVAYADWLFVFAKERVWVSKRMTSLLQNYQKKIAEYAQNLDIPWQLAGANLHDVFEPTFLARTLKRAGNLGHLIFGRTEWTTMVDRYNRNFPADQHILVSAGEDPLTKMFRERGLLDKETSLATEIYAPIFLSDREMKGSWQRTRMFYSEKQLWTLTPDLPTNCEGRSTSKMYEITGVERTDSLFQSIIDTNRVSIGPLEYCGNGVAVKRQARGENM
ncbi:hypothetical protein BD410DRAFT_902077 [Rickenella mellea]|uniref:Uncharacterized protein n=1 Tax=Rickenella mellea TaxID=50990 RepID=A0A4Y7PLW0_9AGAM|nr:hypothetical protein BD410DRAFT_902077 [Rickenella mellea]